MAKITNKLNLSGSNVKRTSQIINDGETGLSKYVEENNLSQVAFSNDYNDLDNLPTSFSNIVYVNANTPQSATIFDTQNPPVINDNSLKQNVLNLYIGLNSSTWTYNSQTLTYTSYLVSNNGSNFVLSGTSVDAGSTKDLPIKRNSTIETTGNKVTNGTNFQFQKGDGSLDSTNYIASNTSILSATKTKITYDSRGLVISGTDATTADINDSLNKRYVLDSDISKLSNLSGVNTGDETNTSIITKRPLKTVQNQTLEGSGNISITKIDVGLSNVDNVQQYPNSNPSSFETPTQLNLRDSNNRNRTNHTGTQLSSTISDLENSITNNTNVLANTSARHAHSNKAQLDLVSGTNTGDETLSSLQTKRSLKTINLQSLEGSGNITIDGSTNLSITNKTATTLDIESSTGTDVTIPSVSTTEAGLMSSANLIKVNYIKSDFPTNLFFGEGAGDSNTPLSSNEGTQNTFIGVNSGNSNTIGYASLFLGYNSGYSQTSGGRNTYLGYQSGFRGVTNSFVTAIGTDAGYRNTADDNIFIGFHAGFDASNPINITGDKNIFFGNETANSLTTGYSNNIMGHNAGFAITTGHSNILHGYNSGLAITTGNQNVLIGVETGQALTTGTNNVYLGFRAGFFANNSTFYNTGVGDQSFFNLTTGNLNTGVGGRSGLSLLTGQYNTFIGFDSGNNALQKTDALFSTAIGYNSYNTANNQVVIGGDNVTETLIRGNVPNLALTGTPTAPTATAGTNTNQIATTAFVLANSQSIPQLEFNNTDLTVWNNGKGNVANNTSFGQGALKSNTTGSSNTAIGNGSLATITTQNENTAVGGFSLRLTNGFANTAVGVSALENITNQNGNTALGLYAGRFFNVNSPLTSSSGSVFIGANTRALSNTSNNEIVIGNDTVGAGSNTATLGNESITRTILRGTVEAGNATALKHLVTKAQTLYTNQTITANKTVTIAEFVNNNELILSVNATSGNITITLPTFTALQGYKVTVKKMDSSANSVLITGVGGINIDGSASVIISGQYSSSTIGANLSQYIIL